MTNAAFGMMIARYAPAERIPILSGEWGLPDVSRASIPCCRVSTWPVSG